MGNGEAKQAAVASARLGLKAHATFSGSLAWPFFYPWPPHNEQRFQAAFEELANRWRPILDTFDEQGVDVCLSCIRADLHDGVSFERFLALLDNHRAAISFTTRATCCYSRWIT
jgi:hypothetical protein